MAAVPVLTQEDFDQLQNQIIELRTKNYDLESKLNRSENEKSQVQEKCNSQEKELQKIGKIMKFPGFQAMRNSKSKKDIAELIDENERLGHQLQRQEEDFKLQSQTFQVEISRLIDENDKLQQQHINSINTSSSDKEYSRLQAENSVLLKTVEELKTRLSHDSNDLKETSYVKLKDEILMKLSDIQSETIRKLDNTFKDNNISENKTDNIDVTDTAPQTRENVDNNGLDHSTDQKPLDYRELLDEYFASLKRIIEQNSINACKDIENTNDADFQLKAKVEELSILQDKLNSHKENAAKEIQELREEISKLTDKTRKKQESLVQLQEEKEKIFEENSIAQQKLKKEKYDLEEELKAQIANLENQIIQYKENNDLDQLQAQLDTAKCENQSLQEQLIGLKEQQKQQEIGKINDLQEKIQGLNNEKLEVEKKLQSFEDSARSYSETIDNLRKEIDGLKVELQSSQDLAVKRKSLLDQASVERHQDVEAHQAKIEELKKNYESETETLVNNHSKEIEDLKKQLIGNKKLKRELEESKQAIIKLTEDIESMEKKTGWLQRTLKETEETLEEEKVKAEERMQQLKSQHDESLSKLQSDYEETIKNLQEEIDSIKDESKENISVVEKLKQAAVDKEVEYRVNTKKSEHLLKDLRRQCNSERKRADQLQMKLQDFIQEIKVKQTYDEIFNPESLQLKVAASGHKRQDSGSHLSLVSSLSGTDTDDIARSAKTSSPVESATSLVGGMSDETMDLITRITHLQQEKWQLEEKVRHLEENGAVMADDLMQKSVIIQNYVMESRTDVSNPAKTRSSTLKDKMLDKLKLNNNEELNREMTAKMQRMLEETLARNVQLQKDLDILSNELHNEKQRLK